MVRFQFEAPSPLETTLVFFELAGPKILLCTTHNRQVDSSPFEYKLTLFGPQFVPTLSQ